MPDTAAYADKQERMQAKKKKTHSEQIQSGQTEVNECMMTKCLYYSSLVWEERKNRETPKSPPNS